MYIYQDLNREYLDNLGGMVAKIQLIPYVAHPINGFAGYKYPESSLKILESDVFGLDYYWLNFGAILETCSFESGPTEVNSTTVIGTLFKAKIPRITLKGIQVCNSITASRCLAIVKDFNGNKRIIGRNNEPAAFRFKEISGESFSNLNHIEIQIATTSSKSPAFLV
jgi:hypothetical protein